MSCANINSSHCFRLCSTYVQMCEISMLHTPLVMYWKALPVVWAIQNVVWIWRFVASIQHLELHFSPAYQQVTFYRVLNDSWEWLGKDPLHTLPPKKIDAVHKSDLSMFKRNNTLHYFKCYWINKTWCND